MGWRPPAPCFAKAAEEIKALISAPPIGAAVNQVVETGEALDQVNTAVNQMDQVTRQNAAMVEQSTAASHALAGKAAELSRLMSQFGAVEAAPEQNDWEEF